MWQSLTTIGKGDLEGSYAGGHNKLAKEELKVNTSKISNDCRESQIVIVRFSFLLDNINKFSEKKTEIHKKANRIKLKAIKL